MNMELTSPWLFDVPAEEPAERSPMEEVAAFIEVSRQEAALITQAQAAVLLGLSRMRISQLVAEDRLKQWHFMGGKYVSFMQVLDYGKQEKNVGGRPSKIAFLAAAVDRD